MLDDKEPPQQQQRGLFDPALVHSVLINDCWTPLQIHSGCRTFRLSYQTSAANRWFIHHIKAIEKLYKSDRKKKSDRYQVWYPATISKINCIPSSIFDNSLHIFPVRRVMQPVRRFFQCDRAEILIISVAETGSIETTRSSNRTASGGKVDQVMQLNGMVIWWANPLSTPKSGCLTSPRRNPG